MVSSRIDSEEGSVDSFLLIAPLMVVVLLLFGLFHYGLAVNEMTNIATLMGRELARDPYAKSIEALAQEKIRELNGRGGQSAALSDFHVMYISMGGRTFLQLVLIGKGFKVGPFLVQPSSKSLTLVDDWAQ